MSEDDCPEELQELAAEAQMSLLPSKSRDRYLQTLNNFKNWADEKKVSNWTETVMLAYFQGLESSLASSTLWSTFSMLKATILAERNVDIGKYPKLVAFLKRKNEGYKAKKASVFTPQEIEQFLREAPDDNFLATKVACVLGVAGACRRVEMEKLTVENVQKQGDIILVKIMNTKNRIDRKFTVDGNFLNIVERYINLRPKDISTDRFFINFQRGKCTKQPIGKNKFGAMPKEIALFLQLENPERYTGHSFRRTSATIAAEAGADLVTLKRLGGWKSSNVAEGYIEDTMAGKRKIANMIKNTINPVEKKQKTDECMPSTSKESLPSTSKDPCHNTEMVN